MTKSEGDTPLAPGDPVSINGFVRDLTYKEAHLFGVGAFYGFTGRKLPGDIEVQGSVAGDSWYAMAGFMFGRTLMVYLAYSYGPQAVNGLGLL